MNQRRGALARLAVLLTFELRLLAQNHFACFVLLAVLLAAGFTGMRHQDRQATDPAGETCYIVYWREDALAQWLVQAAEELETSRPPATRGARRRPPRIKVVPVADVTGPDDGIRYPIGSHSIQIRPLGRETADDGMLARYQIWYWYDGADSRALWPYAQWFWRQVRAFENSRAVTPGLTFEETTSSLHPELVIPGFEAQPFTLAALLEPERTEVALIWLLVFFVSCHLFVLSLAEARSERVLPSLVVTPAGWLQVLFAKQAFYGALAVFLTLLVSLLLNAGALGNLMTWQSLVAGVVMYLGVGLAIGATARSLTSASVAGIAYLVCAGAWLALVWVLLNSRLGNEAMWISPEGALVTGLAQAWSGISPKNLPAVTAGETPEVLPAATTAGVQWGWAIAWQGLGWLCYRRLRRQ